MKLFCLAVILIFQFNSLFSQNRAKTDSLIVLINKHNLTKEEKAILLSDIAFFHPNIDSAMFYANSSMKLAEAIGDFILRAQALEEISHLERRLGNNERSLQASLQALQIYENEDMHERIAASYNQLAVNHMMDGNYPKSIEYLKKAIHIYSTDTNISKQILTRLNLGEAYRLKGDLDSAAINFRKTLSINTSLKDSIIQSYSLGNLGMVHNTQDSLGLAQTELNVAIAILEKLGDPYSTSVYLNELGDVYRKQDSIKLAEEKFRAAMTMAKEAGLKEQIRDFSASLSEFYESQNKPTEALAYQKQFQIYQDSLVNKENIQQIEQLKAGYEIDKRESEISLLSKVNTNQRYFLYSLAIGTFLILLFTYLLYKGNLKIKKANHQLSKQKELIAQREQEKAVLLKELNHRVKNNLQMVSSLLNLQSRQLQNHPAKEAILAGKDRVEALSLVHRKLYQEGTGTKINAEDYVQELVLDLCHGYNASFEPEFDIDNISITIDTAIPLALIVNELVVNALKYAFNNVSKPSLKVSMSQNNVTDIKLHIKDNGIGFTTELVEQRDSFGLKLIDSLIKQLEGSIEKIEGPGTHWKINFSTA